MATVWSGYHSTGTYTKTRVRVDYSGSSATAILLYTRTNSYSGETSAYGATFTFGGASVAVNKAFYGQQTDAEIARVSFSISPAGGTYSGSCNGSYLAFSGSVTIPAQTSTIYYNANGGSGAPGSHSYTNATSGTTNLSSTKPTRTGYSFLGWSLSSTATSASYSAGQAWNLSNYGDWTLYAVWSINSYYLDLNGWLDGASNGGLSTFGTADVTVNGTKVGENVTDYYAAHNYGSSYSISDIKATTGHTYNGVYSGSTSGTIGAGNVSVVLKFSTNTYTVAYNANGGSGTTASSSHTYGVAKNLTANGFSRTGYTFLGWSTSSSATSATYSNQQSVTNLTATNGATVTLYAVWKLITYTVAYDANGGTGAPSSQTKNYGSNLTLSSTKPTRAQTTANGYTLTFDGNTGTASKTSATATNTTTYTFTGWNTAKDGSGTSYSAGGTYSANAGVTLYAQWSSSTSKGAITTATASKSDVTGTRTVNFNTQGGICLTTSLTSSSTLKYTFNGWYTAKSGGTKRADGGVSYTPTATETVYAQYTESGGTYSSITLPAVARDGYKFKGWSTDQNATGGIMDGSYTPSASETLYAIWEEVGTSGSSPDIYIKINGKWQKVIQTLTKANGEWIG